MGDSDEWPQPNLRERIAPTISASSATGSRFVSGRGTSAEQRSELRERLRKIFEAIGLAAQTTNIFDGPEKIDSEQLTASTERLGERLAEFCGYLDELDKLIKRQ
ncbi:hypothetical protein [Candidatus Binatus sp.]|uniref:hypothetical protein n=1 Tax=Candidatus Binatus sp. TaxID=2811406 RepID=UPI003C324FFC